MNNQQTNQAKLKTRINDPLKGKDYFMPKKIQEPISIRISLNENLIFPKEKIKSLLEKAITNIDPRIYPEDYSDSLRRKLAKKWGIKETNILVGNGSDKIIDLLARLTIKEGDNAVILPPTYPMYEHAVLLQHGRMKTFQLTAPPDFNIDIDKILNNTHVKKDKLLFICSPNNPTGNQFPKKQVTTLIKEFPGIVALDETYARFADYSLVPEINNYPNLVIMKSFSKIYAMAGMRVGYAISNKFLINRMKEMLPAFNVNAISIELAKLMIDEEAEIQNMIQIVKKERKRIYNELSKLVTIEPYKTKTNFLLFKLFEKDAHEIEQSLIKKEQILIRNMSSLPLCDNSLRMTISTYDNNNAFIKGLKNNL